MANAALWGEEWSGSSANWDADWGEPVWQLGAVSLALNGDMTLTSDVGVAVIFSLGDVSIAMTGTPGVAGDTVSEAPAFSIDATCELPIQGHLGLSAELDFYGGALFSLGAVSLALTGYSNVQSDLVIPSGVALGDLSLAMSGTLGISAEPEAKVGTLVAPETFAAVGHLGLFADLAILAVPTVDFSISPASGTGPLTVSFTGSSDYPTVNFLWEYRLDTEWFTFATTQNAQNVFPVGVYDIRFTASNDAGQDTMTKFNCVVVTKALPPDNVFPGWSPAVVPENQPWTPETPVEVED